MGLSRRLLLLVVSALPVVWGNCPYWFAGEASGAVSASGGSARRLAPVRHSCPCCRHEGDTARRGGPRPPQPDCDDCPMTVARRGATPVPASVALPGADRAPVAFVPAVAPLPPEEIASALPAVRPPGAPPGLMRLGTVVLTI